MHQLRDYQTDLIQKTASALIRHKRVIMCAPTGSGKTVVFASIIARHLERDMFNRVLVLTHRTELFAQTIRAIVKAGTEVEEIKPGRKITDAHHESKCVVAMVETMKRRKTLPGEFTLVICDEAHRADFIPILETLPEKTYVIGATATPISASKKRPLKNYYNEIVNAPGIPSLIDSGFLAKPHGHQVIVFDAKKSLKVKMGEYTNESQLEALGGKQVFANIIEQYKKVASDKRTLIFCVNAEHTYQTYSTFHNAGFSTEYVLSDTKDRAKIFERFRSGQTQILVNCDIATTGTDIPEIECIIVLRATKSLPLWMQMIGRGARIIPNRKDDFMYIDFGGNARRFGPWEIDHNWRKFFENPDKPTEGIAPIQDCPLCFAILPINVHECTECGHVIEKNDPNEQQIVNGIIVPIRSMDGKKISHLTVYELVALAKSGTYSKAYIQRVVRTQGFLVEYARLMGYKQGWVQHQYDQPIGFTDYTVKAK